MPETMPNPALNRTLRDEAAQRRLCQTLGFTPKLLLVVQCLGGTLQQSVASQDLPESYSKPTKKGK